MKRRKKQRSVYRKGRKSYGWGIHKVKKKKEIKRKGKVKSKLSRRQIREREKSCYGTTEYGHGGSGICRKCKWFRDCGKLQRRKKRKNGVTR